MIDIAAASKILPKYFRFDPCSRRGQISPKMEFEHGTSTRTIARLRNPSFLQLSYNTRHKIYKEVGIISSEPITELTWWTDVENNGNPVPTKIPKSVLYSSKALLADALSAFWSENAFRLPDPWILRHLQLGTPMM
jgi:hypothetical protein